MPPEARVKLPPLYERSVYGIAAGLTISGLAWLVLHYFAQVQGEFGLQTHPAEPWSLKVHGALSALALVLLGGLIDRHVTPALRSRRHLLTGLGLLGFWVLLGVSGYLLYYAGDEDLRAGFSKLHWIAGCLLPAMLLLHLGERYLRRRRR